MIDEFFGQHFQIHKHLFLFCYVASFKGMSDLCVNPKETVYFYIKDQSTLQKTGKGNNIKLLFYIIYQYNYYIML